MGFIFFVFVPFIVGGKNKLALLINIGFQNGSS